MSKLRTTTLSTSVNLVSATETLEARLWHLRRILTLLEASGRSADVLDERDTLDAMSSFAVEAIAIIDTLRGAPIELLNWYPGKPAKAGAR